MPFLTLSLQEWASEKSPWRRGTEDDSKELKIELTGWEGTWSPRREQASGRAGSRCLNSLARHSYVSVSTSTLLSSSFILKQVLSSAVKGGPQPPTPPG